MLKNSIFDQLRDGLLSIDPVHFCENNLTLDGKPFRLNGNGYKPFADIYRYIGIRALYPNSKPVVLVKGRQVGATTMAAALELFFGASGNFGVNGRPPMRVLHAFPLLDIAFQYTKTKLNPMISGAKPDEKSALKGKPKSKIEMKIDKSASANDSLQFKQFEFGNHIQIESTGLDANRLRGRQLCLDTDIPTPHGFVKLRDLKMRDELFDENGSICRVTKLHPIQESPESYRITFDDNTTIDACAEHLWLTYTKQDRIKIRKGEAPEAAIKNTKEILSTLKVSTSNENNHCVPNTLPVQYSKKELLVDPYLLGLWLGDGNRQAQIETADPESLKGYEHHIIKSSIDSTSNWGISKSRSYGIKGLATNLRKLGLVYNPGPSKRDTEDGYYYKYVPKEYMYSSVDQRLALMQGLMDSDGCCYKDGRCEFVQVRERLAFDFYHLALSLGIKAKINKRKSLRYNKQYKDKYRVVFSTELPVFRLKRKLNRIRSQAPKTRQRFIVSVEKIESKPMRCITVDSPSHLYLVTRQYIPTHNTVDCILFDEFQDMSRAAYVNATQILAKAQYGIPSRGMQVLFGTPKQKGTLYWDVWQNSSQQYYYLGCESCEEHFPLYTPESDEWEKIWIEDNLPANHPSHGYIVKCTHCGHEQDKRPAAERGKWVGTKPEDETQYIGFHINQLYMPDFRRWDIINKKPENNVEYTERAYMNEVLGEFFAGDAAPLTPEEIKEFCADMERGFARGISVNDPKRIYLGCDWGEKVDMSQFVVGDREKKTRGQSYSSSVVISVEATGTINIEFARLLKRNDLEYKKGFIDEVYRRYSVHRGVGDIGYANDLTELLHRDYGDRFLASRAHNNITGHVKFQKDVFPQEIVFDRNYYIAELLDLMKHGKVRFPFKSYEQIGWLVNHCTSMEIKPTLDRAGNIKITYVKGSTPNDGFMALLNAYLAYKFDISEGFTIKNPNNMRGNGGPGSDGPPIIGAWIPGMNPAKNGGFGGYGMN